MFCYFAFNLSLNYIHTYLQQRAQFCVTLWPSPTVRVWFTIFKSVALYKWRRIIIIYQDFFYSAIPHQGGGSRSLR